MLYFGTISGIKQFVGAENRKRRILKEKQSNDNTSRTYHLFKIKKGAALSYLYAFYCG